MIPNPPHKTGYLLCKEYPTNLLASFKAYCYKNGASMQTKVIDLMRYTIDTDSTIHTNGEVPKKGIKPTQTLLIRGIPKPVHYQFKAWCVRHGITMKDKLILLMQAAVVKDEAWERERQRGKHS